MAFTLTQLNALETAMASGQLSVNYDGKSITYRSVDDLIKARNLVRAELMASGQLGQMPLSNRGPGSLTTFSRD
jgi:roadblock/LC7 domain-containing protein